MDIIFKKFTNKVHFLVAVNKKFEYIKKYIYLCAPFRDEPKKNLEIWCNGSTRDSGSLGSGSSPDIST